MQPSEQEIDQVNENQSEQDLKITINNKSAIGSAIVKRVKPCPNRSCRRLNVKIDQDNWIVCNECMKAYCFSCGRIVNGTRHYDKKCERYTPV